jgi:hypothetical protein
MLIQTNVSDPRIIPGIHRRGISTLLHSRPFVRLAAVLPSRFDKECMRRVMFVCPHRRDLGSHHHLDLEIDSSVEALANDVDNGGSSEVVV